MDSALKRPTSAIIARRANGDFSAIFYAISELEACVLECAAASQGIVGDGLCSTQVWAMPLWAVSVAPAQLLTCAFR